MHLLSKNNYLSILLALIPISFITGNLVINLIVIITKQKTRVTFLFKKTVLKPTSYQLILNFFKKRFTFL